MEENTFFESRNDMQAILEATDAIKQQINSVIVGQQDLIELLLVAILSDGHILLEGVPGVGKTLLAKLLARTIDVEFKRIQFTPDLMPSDVMGTNVFNPQKIEFEFKKGPIFSNIVLIDEINRAPAKTQSSLFEVMEERTITVDGTMYAMASPFMVVATQNPVEHEGTYQLPEAQLDRFAFKLVVDYPAEEDEVEVLVRHQDSHNLHQNLDAIHRVLNAAQLSQLRKEISQVKVERNQLEYITKIVRQTRNHSNLLLGASPRASVAILNTSKALAALRGRDFITPDDIQHVAVPALRHRVILTAEKEMDGATTDMIIRDILNSIEVPR